MYRRKIKHSRVKNLFKFASQKNKATCLVESALEFDACFHFEYSPAIVAFEAQPLGFKYDFEGRTCPYTPDFLLTHSDGTQKYIEIKPVKELAKDEFRLRFEQKQLASKQLGIELILVTDKQIRVFPVLDNLKLLHRYSGFQALTELHALVVGLVKSSGLVKVAQLVNYLKVSAGEVLSVVARLLCIGQLATDLTTDSLSLDSVIWASDEQ